MIQTQGFGALIHGCAVCDRPPVRNLQCTRCGITRYCSSEHLSSHSAKHAAACTAVVHATAVLHAEEAKLRSTSAPHDPFACHAGAFWSVEATRPFMLARMDLVKTLRRMRTRESVREQLRHVRAMLELSPSDEVMARIAAPPLLLRMGEDQACYDLLRRWRALGKACGFRWDSVGQPAWLEHPACDDDAIVCGDVFGSVAYMCDHDPGLYDGTVLEHTVAMTLLKIKLVVDVSLLQKAAIFDGTDAARRLPQEVLDNIRGCIPQSTAVSHNRAIMERRDYAATIEILTGQIDDLYVTVKRMSDRFWPVMLDHYDHFEGRFRVHDRIGAAECPGCLRNSYDSWIETPGALDYLRAKVQGDPTSLKYIYLYG